MADMMFHAPVVFSVGEGYTREIASVTEMLEFLKEWSPSRRGPIYTTAVRAGDAARVGHLTADQARRAFLSFAEAAGIYCTGVVPVSALRSFRTARGRQNREHTTLSWSPPDGPSR